MSGLSSSEPRYEPYALSVPEVAAMKRCGSRSWCRRTRSAPSRPMAAVSAGFAARMPTASTSEDERLNRMGQTADFCGVTVQPEKEGNLLIGSVHHHHRHFSIRVDEGGGKQSTSAGCAGDSPRARTDKLREVADVVIRVGVDQLTGFRIRVNRGEAEVPDVIRPTLFV